MTLEVLFSSNYSAAWWVGNASLSRHKHRLARLGGRQFNQWFDACCTYIEAVGSPEHPQGVAAHVVKTGVTRHACDAEQLHLLGCIGSQQYKQGERIVRPGVHVQQHQPDDTTNGVP